MREGEGGLRVGIDVGGTCSSEPSSEIALRALNISIVTRTESESVEAVFFALPVM